MNTPHERLTRTTFSLPLGEVHALVGSAVNARPLLFLHGFPDHPPTAVPFLEHLAETHRVVAPWLRGYAPSPIVGPYDLDTLAADAIALIDRLGGQVDLVGHDWGGAITYTVCAAAPSHVHRAVTLAIPHPATLIRSLAHSKQWKKSWYMALFQLPGAGYLVRRRELALIDTACGAPGRRASRSTPRAVTSCTPVSSAAFPHRSSTTARSCARSRRSPIACARPRRT